MDCVSRVIVTHTLQYEDDTDRFTNRMHAFLQHVEKSKLPSPNLEVSSVLKDEDSEDSKIDNMDNTDTKARFGELKREIEETATKSEQRAKNPRNTKKAKPN